MFAAIFPGQGAQYVGMPKELIENFSWTKGLYEEASESIKLDLLKLCLEGPEDKLSLTENGQPSILTTSYAWFSVAKKEFGFVPAAAAGHSLGEYSALAAAESLTLSEAVPLVKKRGELMQKAVPVGKGKMSALIGLDDEKVKTLCERATEKDSIVVPVNFNAPGQVVIAGHSEAVDRAAGIAAEGELKARKVIPLNVSAPFHSPLLSSICEEFEPFLKAVSWQRPKFPIATNLDGELKEEFDIIASLKAQIDHAVLWTTCVRAIFSEKSQNFVEFGPGKVLTGLNRRIEKSAKTHNVDSLESLKAFGKLLEESA